MAFPTGYKQYQKVTIDHTKVPADLSNFTVLINLADLAAKSANIFTKCRTDGGDIRVTLDDGTTELPVDVASIDTTNKKGEVWVKVSSLSKDNDTVLRVWFNGVDTKPADDSTYGKYNAWDANAIVVHHMNGAAADTPKLSNSKANANALSEVNSPASISGVWGNADGAYSFTAASSQALLISSPPVYDDGWQVSAWCQLKAGSECDIAYARNVEAGWGAFVSGAGTTINGPAGTTSFGGYFVTQTLDPAIPEDTWFHVVIQHNGASGLIYYNGVSQTLSTSTPKNNITPPGVAVEIGRQGGGSYRTQYIDEWRQCNTFRSADWIATEYNNQSATSTFYSVSDGIGQKSPFPCSIY